MRQVVDGLPDARRSREPGLQHGRGAPRVRRPRVGAQGARVPPVHAERPATRHHRHAHGAAGGDRGVRPRQVRGDRTGEQHGVGVGVVLVRDQVRGRRLGAEVVDLPAAQPQRLGDQPRGERVPFAVDAAHRDPAPVAGGARTGAVVHQGGDHPLVDRRRRVLLGDGDAVGGPLQADPRLHRRDHVQQQVLLLPAVRQRAADHVDGVVLVAVDHRLPQRLAEFAGRGPGSAHAFLRARPPAPAGARSPAEVPPRGAVMATTAMSSWRLPAPATARPASVRVPPAPRPACRRIPREPAAAAPRRTARRPGGRRGPR